MSDERPVLVLHHVVEPMPNAYEDELRDRGMDVRRVTLPRGEALPDWRQVMAIVAMGGPMGAGDHARWPWLAEERELIRAAVTAGTPYWGVCLGAQLLAAALDAPVVRGPAPEVGLVTISVTEEARRDPVFAHAPLRFRAMELHQDTFALPRGGRRLASSPGYENQVFSHGSSYGLQFHLEAPAALATHWLAKPKYATLLRALPDATVRELLDDVAAYADRGTALARELFGRWLDRVVRPRLG